MRMTDPSSPDLLRQAQRKSDVKYFRRNLDLLPEPYTSSDTNRMTLAYFCISGLDLLMSMDSIKQEERDAWVEWIYSQQIHPNSKYPETLGYCGFRGGSFMGASFNSTNSTPVNELDGAHITMTYTALTCLLILRDDLSRVNKPAILSSLKSLQRPNGSFSPCVNSSECDMRFLYCACCISFLLDDWTGLDKELAKGFILSAQSYDGGFGQYPGQESHGGSTYCAIASLALMGFDIQDLFPGDSRLITWLVSRQDSGFHGRVNKPADTCYAFWIGATLDMLGCYEFVDTDALYAFLSTTHSSYGGYGKHADCFPDALHSYMGISGLAIAKEPGILGLYSPLGISHLTNDYWISLRSKK